MDPRKRGELVLIPSPGIGHLVSVVEFAKLIVARDDRLSVTVLVMDLPFEYNNKVHTLSSNLHDTAIRFIHLPQPPPSSESGFKFFIDFIDNHKPFIKDTIEQQVLARPDSGSLVGFVLDMFCTTMIDVADQLGVPSYIFYTSNAAFLDLTLHLQTLYDHHGFDIRDSDVAEVVVPGFMCPIPRSVLPQWLIHEVNGINGLDFILKHARLWRAAKGIIVNTFMELESYPLDALSKDDTIPPVYPVGPIVNLKVEERKGDVMTWLDDQPLSSVVFLCFGSMGSFEEDQVKEIAHGLERSGHRFLWALRKPVSKEKLGMPTDYENPEEVLPQGFMERTAGIGKVIGWAPQVAVLAHQAIGGFVTHCGWNSILESLWYGALTATLPIYAEQQINAFEMVRELGLAVELRLVYNKEEGDVVVAEELEKGIRCLMEQDSEVRTKVKDMGEECRKALVTGGSSYTWLGNLVDHIMENIM